MENLTVSEAARKHFVVIVLWKLVNSAIVVSTMIAMIQIIQIHAVIRKKKLQNVVSEKKMHLAGNWMLSSLKRYLLSLCGCIYKFIICS